MKIMPFASEKEAIAWKQRKELELAGQTGDRWPVDVSQGCYGR